MVAFVTAFKGGSVQSKIINPWGCCFSLDKLIVTNGLIVSKFVEFKIYKHGIRTILLLSCDC